ncbi:SUMF1/EgtB/PvdO family nonheme iron enzyme [Leptolyngbya sp. Heron Island J]|uniref:SUMF1/EgtB/PvdO family nonheme iron enzyme n=1 Tax=Leptolyngbya sp. Heron Island J TaxID=1385935 RepID=UPI0012695211
MTEHESARRVVRGDSWDFSSWCCRSAYRFNPTPGYRYNLVGFRVVCSAPRILQ